MLQDSDALAILKRIGANDFNVETTSTRVVFKIKHAGDRKALLDQIEQTLKEFHFNAFRNKSATYSSIGHIQSDNYFFIAKPVIGATENLQIKASTMAQAGKLEIIDLFGYENVECRTFKKADDLAQSILAHLKSNDKVNTFIYDTIATYFDGTATKFTWAPEILPSEKSELGKYLGEVLLGYLALKGELDTPFISGKAKQIIFPVSSSFSGIDCAIITRDETLIPISNKFGVGARASFFSNLLPKIIANKSSIPKSSMLNQLVQIAERIENPERKAKEIVYEYGVRMFTSKRDKVDSYGVYKELFAGKPSRETLDLIKKIKAVAPDTVKAYLTKSKGYSSVTGFFCRQIASDLNSSAETMKFLKKILAKKNFFQANLNVTKWLKGEVEYSYAQSGDVDLQIMGDKGSLSDISAKQGLVNYLIR